MYRFGWVLLFAACEERTVKFFDDTGPAVLDSGDSGVESEDTDTAESWGEGASPCGALPSDAEICCWTFRTDSSGAFADLVALNAETGDISTVLTLPDFVGFYHYGLGQSGSSIITCNWESEVVSWISLEAGTYNTTDSPCWTLTSWDGVDAGHASGIVVKEDHSAGAFTWYADLDAVSADHGERLDAYVSGELLTIHDDLIYGTASGGSLVAVEAMDGSTEPTSLLLSYDDPFWGTAVVGETFYVVSGHQSIVAFDLSTGVQRYEVDIVGASADGSQYSGLRCVAR